MIEIEYPFEIINQITSFDFTEGTYDKFKKIMEKFDVTRYWGQKPVQKTLYGRMHKINHLDDILRCEDETL